MVKMLPFKVTALLVVGAVLCAGEKYTASPTLNVDLFNVESFTDKTGVKGPDPKFKFDMKVGKFAYNNYPVRPGNAVDYDRCNQVTGVPSHLTFITRYNHYRKYTHAYGVPIVSTYAVSDAALKRACYVLKFLLADRPVLRKYLYRYHGRIGIMGRREGTTSIPEHRHLGAWWDTRARGLGGTLAIPISTGAEENLLCESGDRYFNEDIFLHEFSHGIQEVAIRGGGIPGYFGRLTRAYNSAKYRGLWARTYAMSTVQEYFAEGVQSYFEVNAYSARPDGVHGPTNTRAKLRSYDPTLYNLVREVFPCMNHILKRCDAKKGVRAPKFRMNCDGSRPPKTQAPVTRPPTRPPRPPTKPPRPPTRPPTKAPTQPPTKAPPKPCVDENKNCPSWSRLGYCSKSSPHSRFMLDQCRSSCECCKDATAKCSEWFKKGYCASNQLYMDKFCRKSCSYCD